MDQISKQQQEQAQWLLQREQMNTIITKTSFEVFKKTKEEKEALKQAKKWHKQKH